jgi:hypothetical protein
VLADALPIEARLAARVLTPPGHDTGTPETQDAAGTRRKLRRAGEHAGAAADNLYRAWRQTRDQAQASGDSDEGEGGQPLRLARTAARQMGELSDALSAAEHHRSTPTLADVAGHRQIAEALTIAATQLGRICERLRLAIFDAFAALRARTGARKQPAPATAALYHAAINLQEARLRLADAQNTFADTWTRRKALEDNAA